MNNRSDKQGMLNKPRIEQLGAVYMAQNTGNFQKEIKCVIRILRPIFSVLFIFPDGFSESYILP